MNCLVNPALHPISDFEAFRYRYLRLVICKPCTPLLFFVSVGSQVLRLLSLLHLQHRRLFLSLRLLISLLLPVPFHPLSISNKPQSSSLLGLEHRHPYPHPLGLSHQPVPLPRSSFKYSAAKMLWEIQWQTLRFSSPKSIITTDRRL